MRENVSDTPRSRLSIRASRRFWFDALKLSWNSSLRIDLSQSTAQTAVRGLIGVVLPLAGGVATGHVAMGTSIAVGAVLLSVVCLNKTSRLRLRVLFFGCVSIAAGAFIGSVTGAIPLLSILAVGIVAFGVGLLVAISVTVLVVGMQSVIAIIFLSYFALDPLHAFFQAALVFVRALLVLLLEVLFSPWHRTDVERKSLSLAFERLAKVASATDDQTEKNSETFRAALTQSQALFLDSTDYSPQGRAFFVLYGEVEQMRLLFIVLHQLKHRLQKQPSMSKEGIICLEQLLQEFSIELQGISRQLILIPGALRREGGEEQSQSNEKIKAALSRAQQWQSGLSEQQEIFQNILVYCNRMVELLYGARRLAQTWRYPDPQILAADTIHQRSAWMELYNAPKTLKANLTYRSTAFRHAVRLGVTLALATALYHLPGFPIGHGFWIPFTAFLVLKPDFNTTLTLSVSRLVGTLGGVILATVLLATLKPTLDVLIIIDAIAAYIAFSTFLVNYALYSVFITVVVVCLLAFTTPQPLTNVLDRSIDTLVGGLFALLVFLVWPTWERLHFNRNLAMRMDTLRNNFVAVMETYIYPSTYNLEFMEHLHLESRLAHSNVDASLARMIHEPTASHINMAQIHGLLGALNAISLSVLTLEGYQLNDVVLPSTMCYRLSHFTEEVDKTLRHLVQSLADKQLVTVSCDDIYAALRALIGAGISRSAEQSFPEPASIELSFFITEAKQIVCNLDIICKLLSASDPQYEAA